MQAAKVKPPCYGCENREIGCHGKCELFSAYKEEHEKQKQHEARERRYNADTRNYAIEAKIRFKKLKRSK